MNAIIVELLCSLGSAAVLHVGQQALGWLQVWAKKAKASHIREFLKQIGHSSDAHIRTLVEDELGKKDAPKLDDAQREELVAVLISIARGARIQNTQGVVRSSFLRNVRVLEQVLKGVHVKRKKGENVAPNGDWILERYLGMGTFGEVWMARNKYFPEPRAFKFFTRDETLGVIRAEAETLSQVSARLGPHPNIVGYLDVAVNNPSNPYLALEYIDGGSLEDWILEDEVERVTLDKHDTMRGLIEGLATAHTQGVYHRDLKPANIVLTGQRPTIPKITDFGLGRVASRASSMTSTFTSQSSIVGTSMYLPPEVQAYGTEVDAAAQDVFAIGVIWYQLLVEQIERPPYDFADELRTSGVESHTIGLISRCLARPEHRFRDAAALRAAMRDMPPQPWTPPEGLLDVSQLFCEYHARQSA